jgi:hypothetical protein
MGNPDLPGKTVSAADYRRTHGTAVFLQIQRKQLVINWEKTNVVLQVAPYKERYLRIDMTTN